MPMKNQLQNYFPMIRTQEEILEEIREKPELWSQYRGWKESYQQEYLEICSGVLGIKMLYDPFFKAIMNPDTRPERLSDFLSEVLGRKVKILKVLPNESGRIAAESSLLVMDIVIQFEDGSIANVEVQKIGYGFPGERSACYSADLLLRQYKRVREELGDTFAYRNIRRVYTIVLFEKSRGDFHRFSEKVAIHRFRQKSDTGLELDLLQEYTFICLDIFRSIIQNKDRKEWSRLDKWLIFLCEDDPEMILELCRDNPDFRRIYKEFYQICRNGERMMEMFSEELEIMDRNTVKLMIDELEEELADIRKKAEADLAAEKRETEIEKKRADAAEKENERLRKELERLRELNK